MATNNRTNGNNNSNNIFNDLNNSDILFINILNSMYNDNLRIIHHLMEQNSEITSQLIDIMNRRNQNNSTSNTSSNTNYNRFANNRNYYREGSNRRYRNNSNNENINTNTQRRVYIDNIPYYIDDLQLYTIPLNSTRGRNVDNQISRMLNSFLEPINITPTHSQIENATRNFNYGDILDPMNNSCPISLEPFTDTSNVTMIRHCRHIFNTNSLMSWFNSNCKCPVCRYDIRNYNSNNNNNNNQHHEYETEEETINHANIQQEIPTTTTTTTNNNNNNNNNNNLNNHSIETLFVEILNDLSNNNIEYTFDNTSQLLGSFFNGTRRRENRR